jgi:hypothetical protein
LKELNIILNKYKYKNKIKIVVNIECSKHY